MPYSTMCLCIRCEYIYIYAYICLYYYLCICSIRIHAGVYIYLPACPKPLQWIMAGHVPLGELLEIPDQRMCMLWPHGLVLTTGSKTNGSTNTNYMSACSLLLYKVLVFFVSSVVRLAAGTPDSWTYMPCPTRLYAIIYVFAVYVWCLYIYPLAKTTTVDYGRPYPARRTSGNTRPADVHVVTTWTCANHWKQNQWISNTNYMSACSLLLYKGSFLNLRAKQYIYIYIYTYIAWCLCYYLCICCIRIHAGVYIYLPACQNHNSGLWQAMSRQANF